MADLSTDVVNQALMLVGGNMPLVTGVAPNFDDSVAGKAAAMLYVPCVATVARQFEWDFSRSTVALVASGNVAPFPWTFEFIYPANAVEIWTLIPPTLADPFDPLPVNFVVANVLVSSVQTKVIHTDLANPLAVCNNNPAESLWDSMFREAVVRLLASEMSMAIAGKPDTMDALLKTGVAFEGIAQTRQN